MAIYIAADGNWGDAEGLVVLFNDISNDDLALLEDGSDEERWATARRLAANSASFNAAKEAK